MSSLQKPSSTGGVSTEQFYLEPACPSRWAIVVQWQPQAGLLVFCGWGILSWSNSIITLPGTVLIERKYSSCNNLQGIKA